MHANYVQQPGCSSEFSEVETADSQLIRVKGRGFKTRLDLTGSMFLILKHYQDIAAVYVNLDVPKWLHILHLDRLNSYAVQFLEKRSKAFEPTYLYTMEKGYFLLSEASKSRHNIHTINISISALHPCFGNSPLRWQLLIINRFIGYDTIVMSSLLNSPGEGTSREGKDAFESYKELNVLGAIARMIMVHPEAMPLNQVLPVFLKVLPLKEYHEESLAVYGCISTRVVFKSSDNCFNTRFGENFLLKLPYPRMKLQKSKSKYPGHFLTSSHSVANKCNPF